MCKITLFPVSPRCILWWTLHNIADLCKVLMRQGLFIIETGKIAGVIVYLIKLTHSKAKHIPVSIRFSQNLRCKLAYRPIGLQLYM